MYKNTDAPRFIGSIKSPINTILGKKVTYQLPKIKDKEGDKYIIAVYYLIDGAL